MLIIKKNVLDKIMWSFFIFILIFYPPIIPHINIFLAILSLIYIATKYRYQVRRIMQEGNINLWGFSIILLFWYVFTIPFIVSYMINDIVNLSHYISLINRFLVLFFTIIPCGVLLLCVLDRKEYDCNFFVEILINAGLLESFLTALSFLFPTVKTFFVNLMGKNSGSILYENTWYITVRSYGFAGTLTDLFGLGIAIIAGIAFFYGITHKQHYIVYSLFIAMSALLNARSGFLLYIASIVFSLIYIFHEGYARKIIRTILAIFVILLFAIVMFIIIFRNSATASWIRILFINLRNFLGGESEGIGSLRKLFSKEFWELPEILRMIIGTAHSKYEAVGYSHSDVGYINDIWFSGIIGCVILYGTLIKIALNVYRNSEDILFRFSSLYILFCFFVFNIKGAAYGYNPGAAAILTVLFTLNYYVNRDKKNM